MDHATIRMILLSAGWKEKEIVEALARTSLEMPVPAPPDSGGAREAFFHLLSFAAFYTMAIGLLLLLFRYINWYLPDPAFAGAQVRWQQEQTGIRWCLALVIVCFPLFLWLTRFLLREMRQQPEKAWSGVRRWLTYLTLFAAALALGGDLITLVFRVLEGELTLRFLLKVLAVLLVAGLAFAYYLLALRMPVGEPATRRMHRAFAGTASVIVAVSVVLGFFLVGSPAAERLRKLDERRLGDLQAIASEISAISLGQNRRQPREERRLVRPLPESLEEVAALASRRRPEIRDPATGELYGYEVLGESAFRLCATFDHARDLHHRPRWNHPPGHHCFDCDLLQGDEPRP